MAVDNVFNAWHGTLTMLTVETINFSKPGSYIHVRNRDQNSAIYARTDGTDPAIGADGSFIVKPDELRDFPSNNYNSPMIKLISSLAAIVSVELT